MGPKTSILLATITLIATIFYLRSVPYSATARFSMSPSSLVVRISTSKPELKEGDTPKFTVSVSNPTSHPITALRWNTPLDPKATVLGIVKAIEVGDPDENIIEGNKIMLRRVTPPPRTDLVEIPSGGEVIVELVLPEFPFKWGKSYRVRVEGGWMSAWPVEKDKVTADMLEAFGSVEDMTGVFISDEVTVRKA